MMADVILDELLVFSDHHAHPFSYGAKEEPHNGVLFNSRLNAACDVLEEIETYADTHDIERIIFGGDLFHTREGVPTDAYTRTFDSIAELAKCREVHMLTGNHDYNDREGKVHSLQPFRYLPNVNVYGWDKQVKVADVRGRRGDNYRLVFCPYTEDRTKAVEHIKRIAEIPGPKVLFAHLGMQGAVVGSDYVLVSDGDLSVSDIPHDQFLGCFFGHYHQHQVLFKNGWFIGASHQHNWGDVNTKRGFLHVKVYTDHVDFDFIETGAPKFISVKESELANTVIRSKDFVKVITDRKMTDKQITDLREVTGSTNTEVIYVPPEISRAALELSDKHFSPDAMVEAWVTANADWIKSNIPDVAPDALMSYGKSILATIQEK